eukprot:COSAG06_NODE_8278_length_2218_cov_2.123643_1_plen_58_part_10
MSYGMGMGIYAVHCPSLIAQSCPADDERWAAIGACHCAPVGGRARRGWRSTRRSDGLN